MTDPVEGFLEDVTAMTRQAAIDGLTLASVFTDLRLILDLEPGDELPAGVLRACAVAWSRTHEDLDRAHDVRVLTWDDLEDRLWISLAGPDTELPSWAVLAETGPREGSSGGGPTLLQPDDVLRVAAGVLAARLDRPSEHVALLEGRENASRGLVALVQGDVRRAEQARSWVAGLTPGRSGPVVTLHRLVDHPEGRLAAIREVVSTLASGD
ncbi:hypothetical protein [Nocardioides sp. W7]|uniref:hypothetical protein n=1 Tax=Nocardioides sp. W7 TaxID=2931390 RepID=UPI001FCFB989|nr:hypothetical protein [Nocardioides sp. W7]